MVLNDAELPNVTVPGPLTIAQLTVGVQPGRQSPVAAPARFADAGNVIAVFVPELTTRGVVPEPDPDPGLTVIVTSELALN